MIALLSPDNVREIDERCSTIYEIPPVLLMENAARSIVEHVRSIVGHPNPRVLVACGTGNNGGDGYAVARLLASTCSVTILGAGPTDQQSEASFTHASAAAALVPILPWQDAPRICSRSWDVVFDAVLGTGGSAELRADVALLVAMLDAIPAIKIAIDVPTGLDSTTGRASADAFVADHTITMVSPKLGMVRGAGPEHCGTIHIAGIGAPAEVVASLHPAAVQMEQPDVHHFLPPRRPNVSKFDVGRVLVIGGSRSMPGAPSLAAHAALVCGAGLVEMASTMIHPATPREVMPTILPSTQWGTISPDAVPLLAERASRASVVVIGPGLGRVDETIDAIGTLLREINPTTPVILDADGLACYSVDAPFRSNVVLTPHTREFAGLTGCTVEEAESEAYERAIALARATGCVVHVKLVPSFTTNGVDTYCTTKANPAMASGGMGDVLCGVIAAMCAQGVHNGAGGLAGATALGAYLHAQAGGRAATMVTAPSVTASMVLDQLPYVF